MKFTPLYAGESDNRPDKEKTDALTVRYKEGHAIGPVIVADGCIFVKKGLRNYYMEYASAEKIFRRVRRLHANICCGDGDIEVEYLVIQKDGRELIEVTLPGKKAAKMLMEEIRQAAPGLDTAAPTRASGEEEDAS